MLDKRGVWGLGVVGKSAIRYLHKKGYQVGLLEKKVLTTEEYEFLKAHKVSFFDTEHEEAFFKTYHTIIRSPGIDIRHYQSLTNTWVSEIDLFWQEFQKPTIGITGTIGKTSVTHLLSSVLTHLGLRIATGGNIGTGALDLIDQPADRAVIELSSFQLEQISSFDAELAIITNLYPNHLDRHGTFEAYCKAKFQLLYCQNKNHQALIPVELYERIAKDPRLEGKNSAFFSNYKPPYFPHNYTLYYFDTSGSLCKEKAGKIYKLVEQETIPSLSFKTNWLIIAAAIDMLGYEIPPLHTMNLDIPAHRLQHLGCVRDITFYDDSKSTLPDATLAALEQLSIKPIILLVGGLSKGVDREPFIKELVGRVKSIHCFGAEAETLFAYAQKYKLAATKHCTLSEAFRASVENASPYDQILLSPAGSSLDLFKNYQERGIAFQELVQVYSRR